MRVFGNYNGFMNTCGGKGGKGGEWEFALLEHCLCQWRMGWIMRL